MDISKQLNNQYIKPKTDSNSFCLPRGSSLSSFGVDKQRILSKLNRSFTKRHSWEDAGETILSEGNIQGKSSGVSQNVITKKGSIERDKELHENSKDMIKSDADTSSFMCNICFALDSDCIFMPCGHGGICLGCSKDVVRVQGECYLCRTPVEYVLRYDNNDRKDDMFKIIELHQFE